MNTWIRVPITYNHRIQEIHNLRNCRQLTLVKGFVCDQLHWNDVYVPCSLLTLKSVLIYSDGSYFHEMSNCHNAQQFWMMALSTIYIHGRHKSGYQIVPAQRNCKLAFHLQTTGLVWLKFWFWAHWAIEIYMNGYVRRNNEYINTCSISSCILDCKLSVSQHVSMSRMNAAGQLNALARISRYSSISWRSLLFNRSIRSNFSYCALVLHFCGQINDNKIGTNPRTGLKNNLWVCSIYHIETPWPMCIFIMSIWFD